MRIYPKLGTSPSHPLDNTLGFILRIFWEPFFLKRSHFWHWIDFPTLVETRIHPTVVVEDDPEAGDRSKGPIHNLFQTNSGWKKAIVLAPRDHVGEFQVGFTSVEGGKLKRQHCSLILDKPFAVLQGHDEARFFAFDMQGEEVILQRRFPTTKEALKISKILLI